MDLAEFVEQVNVSYLDEAIKEVNQNLTTQGLIVVTESNGSVIKIEGN